MFHIKSIITIFILIGLLNHCNLYAQLNETPFFKTQQDSINQINDTPWLISSWVNEDSSIAKNGFMKRFSNDPFIGYSSRKSFLTINPHINFGATSLSGNENYFTTGGGVYFKFSSNSKWSFSADFIAYKTENYLINTGRISTNLIPGVFWSQSKNNGFIAANLRSRISYRPSKYFQIETGIDNQFVGDGYHSMFLGRENAPHPFGQLSTSFWKIDYTVAYHLLNDIRWPETNKTYRKYLTSHQLNFRLHPTFHIYVFEAVIWKAEDSITNRGYDLGYLNPVIFFRPVEFNLGSPSPDNVLMGIGARWQPKSWIRFYGQILIDEFYLKELKARNGWWANKFAMQAGILLKRDFQDHSINFRGEFNMARPFTYSHIQSMQNYGSRFYPLAHPLGANFGELLGEAQWSYKRIRLLLQMAFVGVGVDSKNENFGQNIYRSYTDRQSEYDHDWLQGNFQKSLSGDLRLSYFLNKSSELTISAGIRKMSQYVTNEPIAKNYKEVYLRLATFITRSQKELYSSSTLFQ